MVANERPSAKITSGLNMDNFELANQGSKALARFGGCRNKLPGLVFKEEIKKI